MGDEMNGTSTSLPSSIWDAATNTTTVVDEFYIFDHLQVRSIFILLYTIVFCLCFFGNLMVIVVVTFSRRLRSITNFFLANLAVADFSVAIFCVYQNLFIYIVESWVLGDFLCKMYMFIQSLSNTASIFILVVICTERYFAIIYPITCKQILTPKRLRMIIMAVWITCILYSAPKFYWGNTVTVLTGNKTETVCVLNREKYNSKLFDIIHFVLLYIIPLAVMSLLYTRIAVCLWNSSQQLKKQLNASSAPNRLGLCRKASSRYRADKKVTNGAGSPLPPSSGGAAPTNSSHNVLAARRGVIRMLIVVVCAFALCNLPYHARKMWQYWSPAYHGNTNFSALFTPLTFLATYFNSGVNPLLYAFLSKNFRRGMREILLCSFRRKRRHEHLHRLGYTMTMHPGAGAAGAAIPANAIIQRRTSTRSTLKANNATTVTIINNEPSSEGSHPV